MQSLVLLLATYVWCLNQICAQTDYGCRWIGRGPFCAGATAKNKKRFCTDIGDNVAMTYACSDDCTFGHKICCCSTGTEQQQKAYCNSEPFKSDCVTNQDGEPMVDPDWLNDLNNYGINKHFESPEIDPLSPSDPTTIYWTLLAIFVFVFGVLCFCIGKWYNYVNMTLRTSDGNKGKYLPVDVVSS